ncbi:bacitracin ABC transporter, permease protein [Alkaliphilus metalliredigens QYMF]|uniref:Bacitracin ABC transporter, permease protein n=1 Tax=Alkaliphilus metalliredigens (strain QYMF) TaxID=293826 RepID=A6TPG6_ALKMQ|nr:ABC transporter permease [Alkaliphilus metalliredigens]ABR48084.1 bacitracin ABC transporter, permease protein [Alkaliphilus metalliredigens QYMF]
MNIISMLHCEIRKIIRSNVFWLVFLVFAFGPIMMGVGIILSSNTGGINWQMYLTELHNNLAALGVIGYTFIAAWVFGREFTDKTIKDLLAKPIPRSQIVMSKLLVILAWNVLLSVYMFAIGLAVGGVFGLTGWSTYLIWNSFFRFTITSLLFIVATTPGALLANVSKGYLAPLGLILVIVIFSSVMATLGFAPYFPWTIPSVYLSTGSLNLSSIIILASTGIAGIVGTFVWWRFAEQQ